MILDQESIKMITKQIYRRFPEVDGSQPVVQQQSIMQAKTVSMEPTFVITYQGIAHAPSGKSIPRRVRVVADQSGKILRISTSR